MVWPILPAAGITLALLSWLLGGLGTQRVPPSVVTILFLFVLFHDIAYATIRVESGPAFCGGFVEFDPTPEELSDQNPWYSRTAPTGYDSLLREPVGDKLLAYTSSQQRPERASLTVQMLVRDQMPPLENLIVGGTSNVIGCASAVAIIAGGLFLLYQGLIDIPDPAAGRFGGDGGAAEFSHSGLHHGRRGAMAVVRVPARIIWVGERRSLS